MNTEQELTHILNEFKNSLNLLDTKAILSIAEILKNVSDNNGRLFIVGCGGSAANASHAVNDFRKICNIRAYFPLDNISESSANTNDKGWENVFVEYFINEQINNNDVLFVLSVGGGDKEKNISKNIALAIDYFKKKNAKICSIVGKDIGYAQKNSSTCVTVPIKDKTLTTPISESFQVIIWHILVSLNLLKKNKTTWEKIEKY